MYLCVFLSVCVCVSLFFWVCVCLCVCEGVLWLWAFMCVFESVFVCICLYVCLCECVYVCICLCKCVFIYVCLYIFLFLCSLVFWWVDVSDKVCLFKEWLWVLGDILIVFFLLMYYNIAYIKRIYNFNSFQFFNFLSIFWEWAYLCVCLRLFILFNTFVSKYCFCLIVSVFECIYQYVCFYVYMFVFHCLFLCLFVCASVSVCQCVFFFVSI